MKDIRSDKTSVCRRTTRIHFYGGTLALLAIASAVSIAAASAASSSQPSDGTPPAVEVKIDNFAFTPNVVTVKAGTQLTWINRDDIPHTVDSTDGKFKSAPLDTDEKFQLLFREAGEYSFYCRMHPKMTGKIVVQP